MSERRTVSGWNLISLAILAMAPGVVLYLGGFEAPDSKSLALVLLALIAILPEYIVDATFAWLAAEDPAYAGYAVANITSKYKRSLTRMLIKDIPSVVGLAFLLISLVLGVALAIAMLGKLLPVR
jgi:Ca2+/Na+ antiporter